MMDLHTVYCSKAVLNLFANVAFDNSTHPAIETLGVLVGIKVGPYMSKQN